MQNSVDDNEFLRITKWENNDKGNVPICIDNEPSAFKEQFNESWESGLHNIKEEAEEHPNNQSNEEPKRNFLCDSCDFLTNKNWDLILHQKNAHDKASNMCGHCNKEFVYLKIHIDNMHENVKSYTCKLCGKRISRLDRLKIHVQKVHTNAVVKHTCPVCFKKCIDIENHIRNVHENPQDNVKAKTEKCAECDYTAKSKSNLWSHVATIHKIVTWVCPECNQEMNKLNKSRHMRQHKEKPFSCTPCKKSFQNRTILARHILYAHKHHRNRCEYCGKKVTHLRFHVQSGHKEVDSSHIDTSRDDRLVRNIKLILGVTNAYNGELDRQSIEKIEHFTDMFDNSLNECNDIQKGIGESSQEKSEEDPLSLFETMPVNVDIQEENV